jgi:hypothetical protein
MGIIDDCIILNSHPTYSQNDVRKGGAQKYDRGIVKKIRNY